MTQCLDCMALCGAGQHTCPLRDTPMPTEKKELKKGEQWRRGYQAGWEAGLKTLAKEMKHEQKKMLDGFAHPRNCEMCKKI